MSERFLTPQEVSELLRVRRQTVYELIQAGRLPALRLGNRYRIERADLEEFVGAAKHNTKGQGAPCDPGED